MMKITLNSILKLHPIEIRKEKKNYIIEVLSTTEFYEMPEVCIVAINQISAGDCLGKIEEELKLQFPHEDINLIEFAGQLLEIGMVKEIDETLIQSTEKKQEKLGFTRISPSLGRLFFNDAMKIIYVCLFLFNLILFILNPHLFPHFKDVFIFDVMFQNIIMWLFIGGSLVLIHEMGHILAIRAHGLPTKLSVGHRLFFIVLETDLSLGWKLPSKDRVFLYFAGMSLDTVILFLALMIQLVFPDIPEILTSILAFVVLDVVLRLIYQGCVYMKTDLYYVLENVTGCHNLMENAKAFMFNRKEKSTVFEGEKRTIYLYSIFYFLGLILSFLLFIFYYLPQLIYTLLKTAPGLKAPINSVVFLDSFFVILQLLILIGLLTYSWIKNYKKNK
jgi:putative peptide zinc metalloprotease protein